MDLQAARRPPADAAAHRLMDALTDVAIAAGVHRLAVVLAAAAALALHALSNSAGAQTDDHPWAAVRSSMTIVNEPVWFSGRPGESRQS